MPALLFTTANMVVLLTGTVIVRMLALDNSLDRSLAFVALTLAQVIVSVSFAGIVLQRLAAGPILIVNAVILAAAVTLSGRRGLRPRCVPGRRIASLASRLGTDWWLLFLTAMAVGEICWRLIVAYTLPPLGFDALWYHLTTVAAWLQAGKIVPSPLSLMASVYPANGEIFFTWPSLFLRSDVLVDIVQLGFAVVAAAAVAGIGRVVGLNQRAAAAAGLLFFLAPVVMTQSTIAYVDVIFVASFLLACYFMLRFLQSSAFVFGDSAPSQPDLRFAALSGISAGITLGTKSFGLLYCGVLTILIGAHVMTAVIRRRIGFRAAGRSFSVFAVPLVALGSAWYVRTWWQYGNPIYPVRVKLLGVTLFPGIALDNFLTTPSHVGPWWIEVLAQWYHDLLWHHPRYYSFDARPGGFGPLWSYVAAPLLPIFVFEMIQKKRWAAVNFLLPVAIVFLGQPSNWWSRFTMPVLAVGMIGAVYFISRAPARAGALAKAVVVALVAVGLWLSSAKIDQAIPAGRIVRLATRPEEERTIGKIAYPSFEWVDNIESHARIGVDTSTSSLTSAPRVRFFYPLFGSHFTHRVFPLTGTTISDFRNHLTAGGVDYVMVGGTGTFAELAQEAARLGCLHGISVSNNPVTRAYRVDRRCTKARKQ